MCQGKRATPVVCIGKMIHTSCSHSFISDGRAGINFEHSAIDGHTALRFVSDIFADNVVSFAQSITKTIYADSAFFPSLIEADVRRASTVNTTSVTPKKLIFDLPKSVLDKIYYAETSLSDEIVASDTYVLEFKGFGKTFIVRNNISPDSFVQLSIQVSDISDKDWSINNASTDIDPNHSWHTIDYSVKLLVNSKYQFVPDILPCVCLNASN